MEAERAIVIGAGVGGLAAAIDLASRGLDVTVLERATAPGGKLRQVSVCDTRMDAGPTVFTLRPVFEELFADAGFALGDFLSLAPLETLARHAWMDGGRLDLMADPVATEAAIGAFAGAAEARRFRAFSLRAGSIYQTLERTFIRNARPNPFELTRRVGWHRINALWGISPFFTLWGALGRHFQDPRLRQLFGRYATYCGSSPFQAPATLMLVAHVEREGVWTVEGGMHRLAGAMADLAARCGARLRYDAEVERVTTAAGRVSGVRLASGERLEADVIIVNADAAALAAGMLGDDVTGGLRPTPRRQRSLSAITWNLLANCEGFPLSHHNVFFSRDYAAEFREILQLGRPPTEPTVYICAQDRHPGAEITGPERLLCLINAPPNGDAVTMSDSEIEQCQERTLAVLRACGLKLELQPERRLVTTPAHFHGLFPGTGGALYGAASHGWTASFRRPGARSRIPGLYLAGGSTHPGPGLPMATLSGRLAAQQVVADLTSARRSRTVAMPGGTSTR